MNPAANLISSYQQAISLLATGDLRRAADICKELLDTNPEFAYGYHLMSSLFKATGNFDKALLFTDMALKRAPDVPIFILQQGQLLVSMGKLDAAAEAFKKVHAMQPGDPLAVMLWAGVCASQKDFEQAFALFDRARAMGNIPEIDEHEGLCRLMGGDVARAEVLFNKLIKDKPDYFRGYIHKGKLLVDRKEYNEAEACFIKALKLNPHAWEALYYMAALSDIQGLTDMALRYAVAAVQADTMAWQCHMLMGMLLIKLFQYEKAEEVLRHARQLEPGNIMIMQLLISAMRAQKKTTETLPLVEEVLAGDPDNKIMLYFRAMLCGDTSETAPKEYVSLLFDEYANWFDHHLQDVLAYKTPVLLAEAIMALPAISQRRDMSLLDLGCGTGLGAEALKDVTALRVGVDLSEKMLEKARVKQLYAELHAADIIEYMQSGARKFDLVVAADVLVYIGNLSPFFHAARNVLNNDGVLAFSIEKNMIGKPFQLNDTGRYSHSTSYILETAKENGYMLAKQEEAVVRMEEHVPVQGMMYIFKKIQTH